MRNLTIILSNMSMTKSVPSAKRIKLTHILKYYIFSTHPALFKIASSCIAVSKEEAIISTFERDNISRNFILTSR